MHLSMHSRTFSERYKSDIKHTNFQTNFLFLITISSPKILSGIDVWTSDDGPFLKNAIRHGVYSGKGEPLSSHALDPNVDTRVLMQVDTITYLDKNIGGSDDVTTVDVFDEGFGDYHMVKTDETNVGACGLKIFYQPDQNNGEDCDPDGEAK